MMTTGRGEAVLLILVHPTMALPRPNSQLNRR